MLISLSIVTIIAGIAFYNHKQFRTDIEITNLAYKVALDVRQAQVESISVKQFTTGPSGEQNYDAAYGLHFFNDIQNEIILFADGADGNGRYTSDGNPGDMNCSQEAGSECLEKITIGRSNSIKGWCGFLWSDSGPTNTNCFYAGQGSELEYFDIMFKRPEPDAIFKVYQEEYDGTGLLGDICNNGSDQVACTGWAICLNSYEGLQKRVVVYDTGQISVENVAAADALCGTS